MKLLSYDLSDWEEIRTDIDSNNYNNYYRTYKKGYLNGFYIGLILESNGVHLEQRRWRFDLFGNCDNQIKDLFNEKFPLHWHAYSELEYMKKEIDNFIFRISNLSLFI